MPKPKQSEVCRQLAVQQFETAFFPEGQSLDVAWLGIYQVLLWWINPADGDLPLPHIIDSDKLRPPRNSTSTAPTLWRQRAERVALYIAGHLGLPVKNLPDYFDRLMQTPMYEGAQRQNPLGIAYAGLIKHVIEKYSRSPLTWDTEVKATDVYPGIQLPGRSTTPSIDVLGFDDNRHPAVIISSKYSLRHDRTGDLTSECPVYKSAAMRSRRDLKYYVVTAEMDPARLSKIVNDSCIDGVVHIHKPLITEVLGMNGRMKDLVDLRDFVMSL